MSPQQKNLVVDELLTQPSAVSPTLFVGLGGCGCRLVSRVAGHLRRRPDWHDRYQPLVKFALVDTNINDLEIHREVADLALLISDFEKERYADLASGKLFLEEDPCFTQWVPRDYRFRSGDTAGAGQIRIESRLGLYYQARHKDLVARLRRLLDDLKSHEHGHRRLDTAEIRIILCYSVAGGTGSGSHLPLAYLLRDLAADLGKPWLIGVAVLPAVFEDKTGVNKDGTYANAYAALKETEHLMKLGAPESTYFPTDGLELHYDPQGDDCQKVRTKPFEFLYLIDKPESFSLDEPIDAAADGLYLQFFSPLFGRQAGDYDNYTQHQRFLVPHDFEAKGIQGFTSFYGSYGAAVMLVPAAGLVEYCAQAAALSLVASSFLREIPSGKAFGALRSQRERFDEVTLRDGDQERPVPLADFARREPGERDRLRDRLFARRVRLLAHAELREGEPGRFFSLFRHGHRPGTVPTADGDFELRTERVGDDRRMLADRRMRQSIGSIVLAAIAPRTGSRGSEAGSGGDRRPGLLIAARREMERLLDSERPQFARDTTVGDLKNRVLGLVDDLRRAGRRVLRDGYRDGTLLFPGFDQLKHLQFLGGEAAEVDLAAQRYAVLRILDDVQWDARPPAPPRELDAGELDDSKRVGNDADSLFEDLVQQGVAMAFAETQREMLEHLGDLKRDLDGFAAVQRSLEQGSVELERSQTRRLLKLREEGHPSTERYVLDAEALTSEDGRRLWDFYYEDEIADMPELSLADPGVKRVLSESVAMLSTRDGGRGADTATLDRLFSQLRDHARRALRTRIEGDAHAADPLRRDGLTLSDALELEVVYRALYLSDAERIEREGRQAVAGIVAAYRALPPELREDLGDKKHVEYLRDKVRRVVVEKASLLCVYDEARDQHGGVRPNHVFLAAIAENFENSTIAEALRGVSIPNLEWVSQGWHDPKEIVFYRAVLNVPLYVFDRLDEMRRHYHRFKNLAKRSKTLHIDRNWEDTLPDLDPQSAREAHRQQSVREQVVHFASLLTLDRRAGTVDEVERPLGYVVRLDDRYVLAPPGADPADDASLADEGYAVLGGTLAEAIEELPRALEAEPVKYLAFQQMANAVRVGLAPRVLSRVVSLPLDWRSSRDQLRTQYGATPTSAQAATLRDFETAYQRLHEALEGLLEGLRHREIEQDTLGEDVSIAPAERERARASLRQSIEILEAFADTWHRIEHPEEADDLPSHFEHLFQPLDELALQRSLDALRGAVAPGPRR